MARVKLATAWLGGCSGCHMSFLDLDEWLLQLAVLADIVYSPLIDAKEYPANVDVVLVEGAVANEEHLRMAHTIRQRTKFVVAFGDCAVTGNVTSLRNPLGGAEVVLLRSYVELTDCRPGIPTAAGLLPVLLDRVTPLHHVVPVDYYLPGCPPPAAHIRFLLEALAGGSEADLPAEMLRFG